MVLLSAALVGVSIVAWRGRHVVAGLLKGDTAIAWGQGGSNSFLVSESPRLVCDCRTGSAGRPAVVLLHGSDEAGRREPFCVLLATLLHRRGYSVLTPDLRGFGDSEDPSLPLGAGFDGFERTAQAAARFAIETGRAPRGRFVYIGHSLGGGVALRASRLDPRPFAVIAISPVKSREVFGRGGMSRLRRFGRQRLLDMKVSPDPGSIRCMSDYLLEIDVGEQLSRPGLPPTLVTYGARESLPAGVAESDATAHRLRVVPDAGHYYGLAGTALGCVFYDKAPLETLVDVVERWIESRLADLSG